MIQEAMEKAGENPSKISNKKENDDKSPSKARLIDPKKQELLNKRKKYDPRAAIKKHKESISTAEKA